MEGSAQSAGGWSVVPAEEATGGNPHVEIWQLVGLSRGQVSQLVSGRGIADPEGFLHDLETSGAVEFASRPGDVLWLADEWKESHTLPGLTELLRSAIRRRLSEDNPNRGATDPLSLEQCEKGALLLAGVGTLSRMPAFLVPDHDGMCRRTDAALRPADFLKQWPQGQIQRLLARALFDAETYGRVQFHHRTLREFLAAEWLLLLLGRGLPRPILEKILFRHGDNRVILDRTLSPVAAWLAARDEGTRESLVENAPDVLLGYGDPSALSAEARIAAVQSLASKYKSRDRLYFSLDSASVGRFATPELTAVVSEFLIDGKGGVDFLRLLLDIVKEGRISGCVAAASELLCDPRPPPSVRTAAVRAIARAGTSQHKGWLVSRLKEEKPLAQDMLGVAVLGLFPEHISINELLGLLHAVEPKPENTTTALSVALRRIVAVCTHEQAVALLDGLCDLVGEPSDEDLDSWDAPFGGRTWLLPTISGLAVRVLEDRPVGILSSALRRALRLYVRLDLHHGVADTGIREVKKALSTHTDARRWSFWQAVGRAAYKRQQKGQGRPVDEPHVRLLSNTVDLSVADVEWLRDDATNLRCAEDRLLAFDVLLRILAQHGGLSSHEGLAARIVEVRPDLLAHLVEWKRAEKEHLVRSRQSADRDSLRRKKEAEQRERNRVVLQQNIKAIREGTHLGCLEHLYIIAMRSNSDYWTASSKSVESIAREYGEELAVAAREGWKAVWRLHDPLLPHQRDDRSKVELVVVLGLSGIAADVADGMDLAHLSADLTRRAVRYATREINGFPPWFEPLAANYPEVVAEVLAETVEADYSLPAAEKHPHDVLAKLPWASACVQRLMKPALERLLVSSEPPQVEALLETLEVLLALQEEGTCSPPALELARLRTSLGSTAPDRFAAWWVFWAVSAPGEALDLLRAELSSAASRASELLLALCTRFSEWSDRHGKLIGEFYRSAAVLHRFLPLLVEHVPPSGDDHRLGTSAVGPRDHAERVRNELLSALGQLDSDEGCSVVRELVVLPTMAPYKDWLLAALDRSEARVAMSGADPVKPLVDLFLKYGLDAVEHLAELSAGIGCQEVHHMTPLSDIEKLLLSELLTTARDRGQYPDVVSFRLQHEDVRATIDGLVERPRERIRKDMNRYMVTLSGLRTLGTAEARAELSLAVSMVEPLKQAYRERPSEDWSSEELAARSGIAEREVQRALTLLNELGRFGRSQRDQSTGFVNVVLVPEGVLDLTEHDVTVVGTGKAAASSADPAMKVDAMTGDSSLGPLKVFFSYSHKDESLRDELAGQLRMLEREGVLSSWHDRKISAGAEWKGLIDRGLEEADVALRAQTA